MMVSVLQEPEPVIRPMEQGDLDRIMAVEPRAYEFHWPENIFRECLRVGYSCWVMEIGEELEGYAVVSLVVGEAHIMNLCIRPESQGRGMGAWLLQAVLRAARQEGADTAVLEVRPTNVPALRLYHSHGFRRVGRRRDYYPAEDGREDAVIMSRSLDDLA